MNRKKVFAALSNLQTSCCWKIYFQNVEQYIRGVVVGKTLRWVWVLKILQINFVMIPAHDLYWFTQHVCESLGMTCDAIKPKV